MPFSALGERGGLPIYERIESPYKLAQHIHKTRGHRREADDPSLSLSLSLPPMQAAACLEGNAWAI